MKKRQRLNQITEDLIDSNIDRTFNSIITSKSNDDLFVVDRGGSKSVKRKVLKAESQVFVQSKTEKILLERAKQGLLKSKSPVETQISYDLWSDQIVPPVRESSILNRKCIVPTSGISYNPSFEHHQESLAEALAFEIKSREKDLEEKYSQEILKSTQVIESQGGLEQSNEEELIESIPHKKAPKPRTKAERNRKKARKASNFELAKKKRSKAILKAIDALPTILTKIENEEQLLETRKTIKKLRTGQRLDAPPTHAPLVPLSDELKGSLRCVLPKGIPIREQIKVMQSRGEAMRKNQRKKRHWESPHGERRIKWIAKYKY